VRRRHGPLAAVRSVRETGRVGLLGGSFNPAHDGHRHVSLEALRRLDLDEVWWLVSPQNPLKSADDMGTLAERMEAARSVARHPRIAVSDVEAKFGTRYTVDTLALLHRRFPRIRFVWLMGADNMIQMPRWADWPALFEGTAVAVFARPTYSLKAMAGKVAQRYRHARVGSGRSRSLAALAPPAWTFFSIPLHPASATAIRAAKRRGGPSGGQ